jgi:hypothetical protein
LIGETFLVTWKPSRCPENVAMPTGHADLVRGVQPAGLNAGGTVTMASAKRSAIGLISSFVWLIPSSLRVRSVVAVRKQFLSIFAVSALGNRCEKVVSHHDNRCEEEFFTATTRRALRKKIAKKRIRNRCEAGCTAIARRAPRRSTDPFITR